MAAPQPLNIPLLPVGINFQSKKARNYAILENKFVDGMTTRAVDGINNISDMWDATWGMLAYAEQKLLWDYFASLQGIVPLIWKAPDRSAPSLWICKDIKRSSTSSNSWEVTATLEECFDPYDPGSFTQSPGLVTFTATNGALGGTTGVPTMPSGLVTNDIVIAWVGVELGGQTVSVSGSGWNLGDRTSNANFSAAWAWAYVTGGLAAPTFTWGTPATSWHAASMQLSHVHPSSPIGNIVKANGVASTTLTAGPLTTTTAYATVLGLLLDVNGSAIGVPTSYTSISSYSDAHGSNQSCYEQKNTIGAADSISLTVGSTSWISFLIELKSP